MEGSPTFHHVTAANGGGFAQLRGPAVTGKPLTRGLHEERLCKQKPHTTNAAMGCSRAVGDSDESPCGNSGEPPGVVPNDLHGHCRYHRVDKQNEEDGLCVHNVMHSSSRSPRLPRGGGVRRWASLRGHYWVISGHALNVAALHNDESGSAQD
ncbi:hypothetical protein Sjap_011241 [Stephania japonica]|uniref:Uncharacterized protein n=1 Tax=Stephania japonica TaxID=461633 RepID=A0AAP0JB16_9MAGN